MSYKNWKAPLICEIPENIPQGDMPADLVKLHPNSVERAIRLFPMIYEQVEHILKKQEKCVVGICGGSGVGKTTVASLITYFFNEEGIGAYTHSGDNYPVRVPFLNDAMRHECFEKGGEQALFDYLGTPKEIEFSIINEVLSKFHDKQEVISLRRMGRDEDEVWFEDKNFQDIQVLVLEWTHGNSDYLQGVDVPVYLKSTPEETLAMRKARNRNANTDSPFTSMVLRMEQEKLEAQAKRAVIILDRDGNVIRKKPGGNVFGQSEDNYTSATGDGAKESVLQKNSSLGPMFNAYPDSMGGRLSDGVDLLEDALKNCFSSFYILPSLYHSDLDRGFCVVDYDLEESLATRKDLERLQKLGLDLKLDFILNHASVNSPQFKDLLAKGNDSEYKVFFIDWNEFWKGFGEMTEQGYIQPKNQYLEKMHFRKPGLPILMVPFPDGTKHPYWNTFYQEIKTDSETGKQTYLGQMDLNIHSKKVWDFYEEVLDKLAGYGAKIVRLDAFAYAPKAPGKRNFLNDPETWELLSKLRTLADQRDLQFLPEIHAKYEEKIYEVIAKNGYMVYDFFLPGLLIAAIETQDATLIYNWAKEILDKEMKTVNMLGCHDGIPLLDLKGMLEEEQIGKLIDLVVSRGGYVKDLHGQKNMYYQVNATYYSALGENDQKMVFARALQLFMPGKPQVWYLDLFAGKNDHEAVARAGEGGHKEINRTNLSHELLKEALHKTVVSKQIELLRLRNTHKAFHQDAKVSVSLQGNQLRITWKYGQDAISMTADFDKLTYEIAM